MEILRCHGYACGSCALLRVDLVGNCCVGLFLKPLIKPVHRASKVGLYLRGEIRAEESLTEIGKVDLSFFR
jgi:hypothetical protein